MTSIGEEKRNNDTHDQVLSERLFYSVASIVPTLVSAFALIATTENSGALIPEATTATVAAGLGALAGTAAFMCTIADNFKKGAIAALTISSAMAATSFGATITDLNRELNQRLTIPENTTEAIHNGNFTQSDFQGVFERFANELNETAANETKLKKQCLSGQVYSPKKLEDCFDLLP